MTMEQDQTPAIHVSDSSMGSPKAEFVATITNLLLNPEFRELISGSIRDAFSPVVAMEMISKKLMLTEKEAAAFCSVPVATLRTERCRNRGPAYVKDGKRVLYPVSVLIEYFGERTIKPGMRVSCD